MSKQAKAKTNNTGGGDKFTRWLVIGMVTLVVATGAIFSVISQKTKAIRALQRSLIYGKTLSAQFVIHSNKQMVHTLMNLYEAKKQTSSFTSFHLLVTNPFQPLTLLTAPPMKAII